MVIVITRPLQLHEAHQRLSLQSSAGTLGRSIGSTQTQRNLCHRTYRYGTQAGKIGEADHQGCKILDDEA